MGYWKHNVEAMDEMIIEHLPEKWRDAVEDGWFELWELPAAVVDRAFVEGEPAYWGGLIDYTMNRMEDR